MDNITTARETQIEKELSQLEKEVAIIGEARLALENRLKIVLVPQSEAGAALGTPEAKTIAQRVPLAERISEIRRSLLSCRVGLENIQGRLEI